MLIIALFLTFKNLWLLEMLYEWGKTVQCSAFSERTRGNGFKLNESRLKLDITKKFFSMRVVRQWNRLRREGVDAPSLEMFQGRLDDALSNLV